MTRTRLCLLAVHAHPDDEASKGAGTVARYHAEGVRSVLVCCTGGEEGDILNPAMDTPEVRADLAAVRLRELERAVEIIGYDELILLGYRDSGMPDTPENAHPDAFANAPIEEATDRLVEIIRRERPQVILTYADDQQGYPHPDHLRVHDISIAAWDLAGDPAHRPDLGEPFAPSKMYYSVWSRARLVAVHEALLARRGSSPYDEGWFERPDADHRITTRLHVGKWMWARSGALRAHRTQIDEASPFWFGLSDDELSDAYPWEDWILARSHVPLDPVAEGCYEEDMFRGVGGAP